MTCSRLVMVPGGRSSRTRFLMRSLRPRTSETLTSAWSRARWISLTSSFTLVSSTKTLLAILLRASRSFPPSESRTISFPESGHLCLQSHCLHNGVAELLPGQTEGQLPLKSAHSHGACCELFLSHGHGERDLLKLGVADLLRDGLCARIHLDADALLFEIGPELLGIGV